MAGIFEKFTLRSEKETQAFAIAFGTLLKKGDIILLKGNIGGGKSFFARALIRSLQANPENVPSPTFTLVQTYDTKLGEIWHADLYRLNVAEELEELGLFEAFNNAISLVEWPEIMGSSIPSRFLQIEFFTTDLLCARNVTLSSKNRDWLKRIKELDVLKN
ncbi:MAG: tRNA (adenosine(37)-N6)-threonylcarbamoyltransferase complex ATPase subunit type 1 TsaE [Rhodobacteraceae bacterium]|nr:tRNA (adenosine(37)-N6)-threonylcarbamoyltransferase complex ATPase subunit type 1 TsaE [Paracoccaceae bacterium]